MRAGAKVKGGVGLSDVVTAVLVVTALGAVIAPCWARIVQPNPALICIRNLNGIGRAFLMYTADYHGRFPTNRNRVGTGFSKTPMTECQLSARQWLDPETDAPSRFQRTVNYVEGLNPYLASLAGQDPWLLWKCPAAKDDSFPVEIPDLPPPNPNNPPRFYTAAVTYCMNSYMVERSMAEMASVSDVMLLREFDKRANALLRPLYAPSSPVPQFPFLDTWMDHSGKFLQYNLHASGSQILFADGHAKWFTASRMENSEITNVLDEHGRWTNSDGAIVITPMASAGQTGSMTR